ncbi:MAG: aminotransferase class I/II-fold pyridoxal phosphate-dependent enzyme [Chitinophagaceae bacterium]|nr:MAG: aminotransferase class I/II-fold pyridoxal phosphate-dependent enzyme [Chitinophagaceae bacterium]
MAKRISIQGFEGSFHQIAAQQFFGKTIDIFPCATFRDVIESTKSSQTDASVMAIENSIAGSILANYNLLHKSNLQIAGEVYLPIRQHLLVNPGVRLEDIQEVHSHPMAILQCMEYLAKFNWKLVETEDTALSAKHIHQVANRLNGIGEYYFSQKLRQIEEMNKAGAAVINLGIGSPDMAPDATVIDTLQIESNKPTVHGYQSYKGVPKLREAMSDWYQRWYGVSLDPAAEILPLIGSKEGIMHICMTYLNEGDEALIPNPGYPTYRSAVTLAGAKCVEYKLTEEQNWQPDFDALQSSDLSKVKLMWVNYPHMPTGQLPTAELFEKLVAFGQKHNILICHDNPYSFILNEQPLSLLSVNGAKDVVIELNSLSKSHNMAGWRIGMLCGEKERIDEVLRFKSNMDSGMFLPLQLAAASALALDEEWHEKLNDQYKARREKVFELLESVGCRYSTSQAGLFVWAKVPAEFGDGYALSDQLLNEAKVFLTPGGIFGNEGDNYIRVSLCSKVENLELAIQRIKTSLKK